MSPNAPGVAGWSDLLSGPVSASALRASKAEGSWSREPVEDHAFLGLPDSGYGAIRITATAESKAAGKSWSNGEIVVVEPRVDNVVVDDATGDAPRRTEGDAP